MSDAEDVKFRLYTPDELRELHDILALNGVPRHFEYMSDAYGQKQRIHVTVLEHFVQHYTGEHMYRIRMENEYGFVREGIYSKGVITYWLEKEKKD